MKHCLISFCLVLVSVSSNTTADDKVGWKAGVATRVVTPDKPMWMAGYASRDKPSAGKVHDLFVKALALEDADGRLVIVTSDLISVPRPIRDTLEKQVKLSLASNTSHSGISKLQMQSI